MNRTELVECIATEMKTSKAQANRFVTTFLDTIYCNIRKEGVHITGLGTFTATKRPKRAGRNPKTGEALIIPEKWVPVFKAGSALKASVTES